MTQRRLPQMIQKNAAVYLMALPALVWFLAFVYYPAGLGLIVSFQKYRLVSRPEWVGFANYARVFSSPGLWRVVGNTVVIGGVTLVLNIAIPVTVALLLNEIHRGWWKKGLQTSLYISHLFGWVVIAGIWIFVLSPDKGILNILLRDLFGIRPIHFLSTEEYGKPLIILLIIWKELGYLCILYLASISTINPELYESALIDGAGRFKQMRYITLPSIVPTIKILAILGVTNVFKLFDPVWVLRNAGNSETVDTIMIYVKQFGIDQFQFGYTSAISALVFFVILLTTLATKRFVGYDI